MLHAFILAAVLNGTVVFRPASGADQPVGGALVEISQEKATVATAASATDGTFSIPDLPPGTYSIQIFSNHVNTRGTIVVHEAGEPSRTFYVFDTPCGAMFGRVRNAVTGEGVPHAEVDFWGSSKTDENGDYFITYGCDGFNLSHKLSGTSWMWVTARRYKRISRLVRAETVTTGLEGFVLDFELQPLGTPPEERLPGMRGN